MNLAMDQFEALRGYTADSYQRDMDQAAADVLGLGDIADNVISAADEHIMDYYRTRVHGDEYNEEGLEEAMRTEFLEKSYKLPNHKELVKAQNAEDLRCQTDIQNTPEWNKAETEWQAEKEDC